jgi:hypothetical protein
VHALAALSVEEIAERIEVPLARWAGNCYGIALAMVEAGLVPSGSRAVYGHWLGPIDDRSTFASRQGLGLTGHGWVETPGGQVLDPTRWAFENVDPYLYVGGDPSENIEEQCLNCGHLDDEHDSQWGGPCAGGDGAGYDCGDCLFEPTVSDQLRRDERYYDEGGNRLREANMRPLPPFAAGPPVVALPTPANVAVLLQANGHAGGPVSGAQAHWLATLPLSALGPLAEPTYRWLIEAGLSGLVPLDNRMSVLGGCPTAA